VNSKSTAVVAGVSILAGVLTFILVQKVTKKGVKVSVKTASAKCNDKKNKDTAECKRAHNTQKPAGPTVKVCTGKAPQCLAKLDYKTTDKGLWTAQNLKGKVVMVNVWATWCKPCIREIPALTKAYAANKDRGFVLLGVLIDDPSDEKLKGFSLRTGLEYPVVRYTSEILDAYERPRAIPTTFIYDRGGNLRFRHAGPVESKELSEALEELLVEKAP